MALSPEEKNMIAEEETIRFEARMKAHENLGSKSVTCSHCGQKSGCRGCRIWAWIAGAFVLLCLFKIVAWHGDCGRFYGHDGRGRMEDGGPSYEGQGPDGTQKIAPK